MFQQSVHDDFVSRRWGGRDKFLSEGFLVIDEVLSERAIAEFEAEIARLELKSGSENVLCGVFKNANGLLSSMNKIDKESDFFWDFARHPTMLGIAEIVLGKAPISLHAEFFSKPPGVSTETPPHQDHAFYVDHFDDELAMSFWFALDDVTQQSGAMEFLQPSQRTLLSHHKSDSSDFALELEHVPNGEFVCAPVGKGGCVIHHSFAIHKAPKNNTLNQRRAVVFNYRGSPYRQMLKEKGIPLP